MLVEKNPQVIVKLDPALADYVSLEWRGGIVYVSGNARSIRDMAAMLDALMKEAGDDTEAEDEASDDLLSMAVRP